MLKKIKEELEQIAGLKVHAVLSQEIRNVIATKEEGHNLGVREALARQIVLLITHDDQFRDPWGEQVCFTKEGHYFPPLPFPEVQGHNVVSSSPSKEIHDFLINQYKITTTSQ